MNFEDVVQLHIDTFGVEPEITGVNYWESDILVERLVEAINSGVPYVEKEVETGVDI